MRILYQVGGGVVGRGLTDSLFEPNAQSAQRHNICRKITGISRLELSRNIFIRRTARSAALRDSSMK
jgi:hypothetical protein